MRGLILSLVALALVACSERGAEPADTAQGCTHVATHDVTWSNAGAPDVITTRSEGPTCLQAVVTFVARNAAGDPLWTFASTYFDLSAGGIAPDGASAITDADMQTFLDGWADVTVSTSTTLPEWREGVTTLTESASVFTYDTPFERDTYEMLRARDLAMICYAAAVEATQCLVIDTVSQAPTMIATYGP